MPVNIMHDHGGNLERAAEIFRRDPDTFLDFSANINPLGIPAGLKEVLAQSLSRITSYPDPEYKGLRQRLAEYTGISADRIIPGNGAAEIISLLFQTLKPDRVLIPAPAFAGYEKSAVLAGAEVYHFELRQTDNFQPRIEQLVMETAEGFDCLALGNPNNPTSVLLKQPQLDYLIRQAARYRVLVVIDEAFIELTEGASANSMAPWVKTYDNLFIIRAFTKIFAVPGLRLGYGIGNQDLINRMFSRCQPWPVNTMAVCAGEYLPRAGEYLSRTSAWLKEEKEWLYGRLRAIPGLKAFPPEANFILVKLLDGAPDAGTLCGRMGKKGILIRNAANFRYLNDRYFRVAVKDRASNQILVEMLREELAN
ncbi:MAG: threonine-phosphate decarboxylase CobD [Firmicutes bacterium]|nr:threonine-phosphate decarboxylase CobD [Bacillota bacterium]